MSDPSDTSAPASIASEPAHKLRRLLWWLHPKVALPLTLFGLILFSPFRDRAYCIDSVGWDGADDGGQVDVAPAGRWLDEGFRFNRPTKRKHPMDAEATN